MTKIEHPAFDYPIGMSVQVMPDDPDIQVEETILLMRRYAVEASTSPEVLRDAEAIKTQYTPRTQREVVSAVHTWVSQRVTFRGDDETARLGNIGTPDKPVAEVLIRPRDLSGMRAGWRAGDCDDFSMYAASLLLALGLKASFATLAADGREPERFSHVYVVAYTQDGERIPVDASHGPYAGWEAENKYGRLVEWPLDSQWGVVILAILVGAVAWLLGGSNKGWEHIWQSYR